MDGSSRFVADDRDIRHPTFESSPNPMRPLSKLLLCSTASVVSSMAGSSCVADETPAIIHEYTLAPFSLQYFGYTAAELAEAQNNGLAVTDRPGIGSGLQRLAGNHYLSVTDRGPNLDRADGNKAFPLPQFTPTIALFKAVSDSIVPLDLIPIVNELGQAVTGIPNGPADDSTPYLTLDATTPLAFNPDGMDIEDIHELPGGGYILVEEYGPSVVIVSATGEVLKRYIPAGKSVPGAHYPVSATLPSIFKSRRANRGFEALAVSDDGHTAYTMVQSPMGSTSVGSPYRDSRVIRILRMDVSDPLNLQITGEFVMLMQPISEFSAGAQRDLKISSAAWISNDRLLVVEASDLAPAKVVVVDLTQATDVKNLPSGSALPLVFEDVNANLGSLGVAPAATAMVLDIGVQFPQITARKLEGLSILNANEISISNDNDFGIGAEPDAPTKVWTIRLGTSLR